ncbi:hypothetical protein [Methylococcus mesophilus]|uniref:hypothetical protein n=1 Tax=Methylococcus mesophilus TaxID=2993564 RepID=UPI00224AB89A|nr:hypothetical protein [Methylococcus mesophilus]UZR28075.1 hypothetical protein OOT43_15355 [Methylococcus mesophilus]UZR30799.1 hypothetical protein OOT43_09270 [Methylococcus mesophilus]
MLNLAGLNGVKAMVTDALVAPSDFTMNVSALGAPWVLPPVLASGEYYYLTIIDQDYPTKWERVKVTACQGMGANCLLAITRNVASSTGVAQTFTQGAFVQWSPGVEEMESRWRMILSASMTGTNTMTSTRFVAPFSGSTTGSMGTAYWINRTGKTLRLSNLVAALSTGSSFSGDSIVVSVEAGSTAPTSPSALQVVVSPGDYGFKSNNVNTVTVGPDSLVCFMLSRSNTGAAVSGGFQLANVSVLAEEL